MRNPKWLQMLGIMLIALFMLGCVSLANTPVPETPEAANTSEPPSAATNTLEPPLEATNLPEPASPLETAGPLCSNAFSRFEPNSPLVSGSVASPMLTFLALSNKPDGPGSGPWLWSLESIPDTVEAPSAESAKAILCIVEMREKTGKYEDGSPAYRPSWSVQLLQLPEGNLIGSGYFTGELPPETIPANDKQGIGERPTKELSKWLQSLMDDKKILHPGPVNSVAFSPDGQTLAVGGRGGAVHLWDFGKKEDVGLLLTRGVVDGIAYSPDGQTIASQGYEEINFWKAATGEKITLAGSESGSFVAYSPDGKLLATGGEKIIRLLDAATGEEIKTFTAENYVSEVVFSPDGQILATLGDKRVDLWDVGTGKLKKTLGSGNSNRCFDFSPDGETIAIGFSKGFGNGQVGQWDTKTWKERGVTGIEGRFALLSLAYSPDGKFLATGHGGHEVKLWEAATGKLIKTYTYSDAVYSVAFSPDGKKLASGSSDGTVMIWDVTE